MPGSCESVHPPRIIAVPKGRFGGGRRMCLLVGFTSRRVRFYKSYCRGKGSGSDRSAWKDGSCVDSERFDGRACGVPDMTRCKRARRVPDRQKLLDEGGGSRAEGQGD